MAPAEDQHTVRPSVSVMAICVLLNDAAMCTRPCGMTRRSRFFLNSFLRFVAAAAGFPGAAPASGVVFCCSFATFAPFLACCLFRKLADGLKPAGYRNPGAQPVAPLQWRV